jgi:hypothetical protein
VLGAGALGYPFCFKECGLLLATIIMFATLVATRISYQLLLYCAQLSGRKSYESIAEYALGRTGRQIVEFCIAAMNLGALVAFLDILADVLSSVAGTIIPPGAEPSRHAYIAGVTLLGALPISLVVREPSLIANMSNAAVVFVVVFAVVVFCTAFGPSAAAALGVRWAALTHDSRAAAAAAAIKVPVLHMWNPQVCADTCMTLPGSCTTHGCHPQLKQCFSIAAVVCEAIVECGHGCSCHRTEIMKRLLSQPTHLMLQGTNAASIPTAGAHISLSHLLQRGRLPPLSFGSFTMLV